MIENTRFHEGYYLHIRKTQSDTELDMVCHTGTITMIAKYEKYPGTGIPTGFRSHVWGIATEY